MNIFLLRHAEAALEADCDENRELTSRGRQQLLRIISARTSELEAVQQVWVSPYVRAQQTLALARPYLPEIPIATTALLTPDQNPLAILQLLENAKAENCLLVTHQPLVGSLLDWLCDFARGQHFLGTSALASIDLPHWGKGLGHLRWLDQPS